MLIGKLLIRRVFFSVMNILTFLTASLILFKTMPSTLQETLTVFPRIQVIPHEYVRIPPYKAHLTFPTYTSAPSCRYFMS